MNDDIERAKAKPSSKKDIHIALIGVFGIIVTALFSNWDKIYPDENIVISKYSGYQPSDNAETEIKYLLHITGAEDQMTQMQTQMLNMQKQQFSKLFKSNPEILEKMYAIIDDELPRFNEKLLDILIEMQSQYFTQEEIRELNKFYSTPIMREFIRRQPLLLKTFMGQMQPVAIEFQTKLETRFKEEVLKDID